MIIDGKRSRVKACRHGLMQYFKNDLYIGASLDQYGEYSESEVSLFREIVSPGSVIVEAGANIGTHTLFLSRATGAEGQVIAFEPQRQVHQMLCANIALNELSNVHARQLGLGAVAARVPMWEPDYDQVINFGGVAIGPHPDDPGELVDVITLDSLQLPALDFLKIDVEGMERDVLLGGQDSIRRHRPVMYIENDRREHSQALLETIFDLGYRAWWHLAMLYNANNFFGNSNNTFGSLLSVNLLCLPRELDVQVNNMDEVSSTSDTPDNKRILGVY